MRIRGGTDVKWSPPFDYFQNVFLPTIRKMGAPVNLTLVKRGYYPRGGGEIAATIEPVKAIGHLDVSDRGALKKIGGIAHVSNLPRAIAERMKTEAVKNLKDYGSVEIEVKSYESPQAVGPGGATVLWAEFENTIVGSDSLAEKGLKAERVAQLACEELKRELESKSTLDIHCSDQVLPYMAYAEEPSCFTAREISGHAQTNMWLIEQFTDVKFSTEKENGLWKVGITKQ